MYKLKIKFILIFILVVSLGFHVPSDAYAADGDVTSTEEINDSTANGPELGNTHNFGISIANIGDLDGDGVNDLAVGAHGDDDGGTNRGAIHILFMNTDGSVDSTVEINDYTANGPELSDDDYFGSSIANIGDLNGDGVEDIAVGATGDDDGGKNRGAIHIMFMNTDGSVDSTVEINDSTPNGPELSIKDNLGFSIANIGDLDGDGINDIAVGAHQDDMDETGDDEGGTKRGAVHIMFLVGTPVPLTATKSSATTVDLSWDTARGSPTYTIHSSLDNASFTSLGTTTSSAYQHEDVSFSHTIYYKITFTNVYGESIESSIAIITPPTPPSSSLKQYAPHIHDEVTVSINSNEEFNLNFKDKEFAKITSRVGDTVDITISVGDEREVHQISQVKFMTNFAKKPSGINNYFANNYNDYRQVALSVYEWNQRQDDVKYDHDGTISWNEPSTMIQEYTGTNHDYVGPLLFNEEELIILFSLNMNNIMDETQIITKIRDGDYMLKRYVLPFTLETLPKVTEKIAVEFIEEIESPVDDKSEFFIKSNKSEYENGNRVVITGQIPIQDFDPKQGQNIEFSITSPENEVILSGQSAPKLDGSFIFETFATDSTWKTDGDHSFNFKFGSISSNLVLSYDNSQFENVDLETRTDVKVVESVVAPSVVAPSVAEEHKSTQLGIAAFVDQSKDPQHYIDRYFNESKYKQWFDKNYPQYTSIYEAVGLEQPVQVIEEPVKENIVEIKTGKYISRR